MSGSGCLSENWPDFHECHWGKIIQMVFIGKGSVFYLRYFQLCWVCEQRVQIKFNLESFGNLVWQVDAARANPTRALRKTCHKPHFYLRYFSCIEINAHIIKQLDNKWIIRRFGESYGWVFLLVVWIWLALRALQKTAGTTRKDAQPILLSKTSHEIHILSLFLKAQFHLFGFVALCYCFEMTISFLIGSLLIVTRLANNFRLLRFIS